MAMRSPNKSASSKKWVVKIMVRPVLYFMSKSQIDRLANGSMPAVGSSKKTILRIFLNK